MTNRLVVQFQSPFNAFNAKLQRGIIRVPRQIALNQRRQMRFHSQYLRIDARKPSVMIRQLSLNLLQVLDHQISSIIISHCSHAFRVVASPYSTFAQCLPALQHAIRARCHRFLTLQSNNLLQWSFAFRPTECFKHFSGLLQRSQSVLNKCHDFCAILGHFCASVFFLRKECAQKPLLSAIASSIAILSVALLSQTPSAHAQGVPIFDGQQWQRLQAQILQKDKDQSLQRAKKTAQERIAQIEQEQLAVLQSIIDAETDVGGANASTMVNGLEGDGTAQADAGVLYAMADSNPAAGQLFGDASGNVEELIIRVAKETHGYAGVSKAGLSVVQWRCLLQALIWQESRFSAGARSPAAAFGLTQIIPDTAKFLGIYPEYYTNPYLQVEGGARYLARMLNMFGGNIIHALAGYNAGPGAVQKYSGVPPYKETQNYVKVIPVRYNLYLSRVGGIEALGSIDPALLANSTMSLDGLSAGAYGDYSLVSIKAAAARIHSIIDQIKTVEDLQASWALNTYARAELVRLMAIRTRLKAAQTKPLSSAQLAIAAQQRAEEQFMNFEQGSQL